MKNFDNNKKQTRSFVNARGLQQPVLVLPLDNATWTPFQEEYCAAGKINAIIRIDKKKLLVKYFDRTATILRPEEIDFANRFRNKKAKENYICSKLATRIILGAYLKSDPFSIRFKRNRWGKPALLDYDLHFSVSHSSKWLIVGISPVQKIGVDLEQYILAFDYSSLVDSYFHSAEKEVLMSTYSWAQKSFFKLWTRKEALAKVIGLGLHEKLLATNMLDSSTMYNEKKLRSFFVIHSFLVDNQHVGALALRNDVNAPIFYNFL